MGSCSCYCEAQQCVQRDADHQTQVATWKWGIEWIASICLILKSSSPIKKIPAAIGCDIDAKYKFREAEKTIAIHVESLENLQNIWSLLLLLMLDTQKAMPFEMIYWTNAQKHLKSQLLGGAGGIGREESWCEFGHKTFPGCKTIALYQCKHILNVWT